jgi:hypothetical protein
MPVMQGKRNVSTVSRYEESFLLSKVRGHAKISSSDLFVAQQAGFFGAGWKIQKSGWKNHVAWGQ